MNKRKKEGIDKNRRDLLVFFIYSNYVITKGSTFEKKSYIFVIHK